MTIFPDHLNDKIISSIKSNKALLIDFDGTLVDYVSNESKALDRLLTKLKISNELLTKAKEDYSKINSYYWSQFELKKLTIKDVQLKRFEDLCQKYNINANTEEINKYYLESLVQTTEVKTEIIQSLKSFKKLGIKLVVITNGVHWTQTARLENSGIAGIIDAFFTSESVGFAKPHPKMFLDSKEFLKSEDCSTNDLWVIGDNFEADIKGANNVGFNTCWVSKNNGNNQTHTSSDLIPTLIVNDFLEFADLYLKIKNTG